MERIYARKAGWDVCSAWGAVSMAGWHRPALAPAGSHALGWMVWRPCYLAAVGGGQATLLPEAEGTLQLLRGAQGEGVGLTQATQQGQAGREAGQVVATWDKWDKEKKAAQGEGGWPVCSPLPCSLKAVQVLRRPGPTQAEGWHVCMHVPVPAPVLVPHPLR